MPGSATVESRRLIRWITRASSCRPAGLLRFCTGDIAYHHIHHLDAQIPHHRLERARDRTAALHDRPTLSLVGAIRATKLELHEERRGRLVDLGEAQDRGPESGQT